MKNEIYIRPATIDDLLVLTELLNELFTQDIEFIPDFQKQKNGLSLILSNPQIGEILVLECDSEIVGMVSILYSISTALGGKVGTLEDMIITKKFRKQGFGSQLLTKAIEFAKDRKCLRLTLLTDFNNDVAIHFYKTSGFQKSAMIPMRLVF